MLALVALLVLLPAAAVCILEDDLVATLPGLIFSANFKSYAGYLHANQNATWRMFYWLTESQSDPAADPFLVWFNGGPGCSSFAGAFEELGPLYLNRDGETLYENVFAWNKRANVLYLESPIGVGFSYDTQVVNSTRHSDDLTAQQNYYALYDFFARVQPRFGNASFFLTGESYAGHYIPQLANRIIDGIANSDFPNKNFKGIAIGNGEFSSQRQSNSIILWSFYHGRIALDDWTRAKKECKGNDASVTDLDMYDFFAYFNTTNNMDYFSNGSACGNLLEQYLIVPDAMDPYNFYQDCYSDPTSAHGRPRRRLSKAKAKRVKRNALNPNTALTMNVDSTDSQFAYPCWNDDAMVQWANRRDVQAALHIDIEWQNRQDNNGDSYPWMSCNDGAIYNTYWNDYPDMTHFFNLILSKVENVGLSNFRMLIYNGDVDTVCNYLGDAWFMQNVADINNFTSTPRERWWYRQQNAGFVQRFSRRDVVFDVLTVKGSGHFVPNDRPGPALQMMTNFAALSAANGFGVNYSSAVFSSPPTPGALLQATVSSLAFPGASNLLAALLSLYLAFTL